VPASTLKRKKPIALTLSDESEAEASPPKKKSAITKPVNGKADKPKPRASIGAKPQKSKAKKDEDFEMESSDESSVSEAQSDDEELIPQKSRKPAAKKPVAGSSKAKTKAKEDEEKLEPKGKSKAKEEPDKPAKSFKYVKSCSFSKRGLHYF
jgi:replication factor C subunit 1